MTLLKKLLKLRKNKLAFELASQEYSEFGHYLKYLAEHLRYSEFGHYLKYLAEHLRYSEFGHYLKYLAEHLRHSESSTNLLKVSPFSARRTQPALLKQTA
jgi:lysine/ornithine N-monooxygenase